MSDITFVARKGTGQYGGYNGEPRAVAGKNLQPGTRTPRGICMRSPCVCMGFPLGTLVSSHIPSLQAKLSLPGAFTEMLMVTGCHARDQPGAIGG